MRLSQLSLLFAILVSVQLSWAQDTFPDTEAEVEDLPSVIETAKGTTGIAPAPKKTPVLVQEPGPSSNYPPAFKPSLINRKTGRDPFFLGHLVTPSVSTLHKGQWTAGSMALGYGFSNEVMAAVSPWLMSLYNMNNLAIRVRGKDADPAWGFQGAYFKTDKSLGKVYDMEATGLWGLWRKRLTNSYRVVFSLNYFYFNNDNVPFSLRRWSLGDRGNEKSQWTFTTLHEMGTGGPFRLYVEAGILGFTYKYPNYHFGASWAYRWKHGYFQFGLSATGYLSYLTRSAYNQVYTQYKDSATATMDFNSAYKNSVAVHPELQIQFMF